MLLSRAIAEGAWLPGSEMAMTVGSEGGGREGRVRAKGRGRLPQQERLANSNGHACHGCFVVCDMDDEL